MAKLLLLEEFHLSVLIPHTLPEAECLRIRGELNSPWFRKELLRAVKDIFATNRTLQWARVRVSR